MKKFQTGLTIIELMISVLLSSFLMLGLVQIYLANSQTSTLQNSHSHTMASARVAIDLISRDTRMADFRGCKTNGAITNHLDTTDSDYNPDTKNFLGAGLEGQDDVNEVTVGTKTVKNGSDILVLRGSNDACGGTGRMMNSATAAALHASQDCPLNAGQVIMVTNCQGGELFSVTNIAKGSGGDSGKRTITHNQGKINIPGAIDNASKTFSNSYGAESSILVPYVKRYFIADGLNNDSSLFVNDTGQEFELVPGVTDFQVLYGEDTDNDGAVNVYREADDPSLDMDNVKNIRFFLTLADGSHTESIDTVANIRNRK